jgi:hypothetical protein
MKDQALRAKAGTQTGIKTELASPFTALGQPLGLSSFQQTTGRWISALRP